MTRRRIILASLALLALLTLACNDYDMDRSEWGWDGRYGDAPDVEQWEQVEVDDE